MKYRRAMRYALWFSAAFALVCLAVSLGAGDDAPLLRLLALLGAILTVANIAARRFFLP